MKKARIEKNSETFIRKNRRVPALAHLFQPSGGVSPGLLVPGDRGGQASLLRVNVGAALDREEDYTAQQGVSQQQAAYHEVYDASLEEGVLASLVRHPAEAKASHLPGGMRLCAVRRRSF